MLDILRDGDSGFARRRPQLTPTSSLAGPVSAPRPDAQPFLLLPWAHGLAPEGALPCVGWVPVLRKLTATALGPEHAISTQGIRECVSPQVTVLVRPQECPGKRACCCTFALLRHEALVRREAPLTEGGVSPSRWVVAAVRWELGAAVRREVA